MSVNPKFSLIFPLYNVEKYLNRCLDSVIKQSLMDIEIICVDDGSTDNSFNIAKQYEKDDRRVKAIKKENGGPSSARNAGLKMAKGDYICFLDSDDYIENNFCERIYSEILEHRPDIIVFGGNIFPLTKDTDPWTYNNLSPWSKIYPRFTSDVLLSPNRGYPFAWRNCFKRKYLIKKKLVFNEELSMGEDTVFQVCAFPGARKIVFISDKLYNYRYGRKESLMFYSRKDNTKRLYQHLEVIKAIAEYWKDAGYLTRWNHLFGVFALDFIGDDLVRYKLEDKKVIVRKLFAILDGYGVEINALKIPSWYRKVYIKLILCANL